MPGNRRPEDEIRREIAAERAQLVDALADLRTGMAQKRRLAAGVAAALAAGLAAAVAVEIARRLGTR